MQTYIDPKFIRVDLDTQSRIELNDETVQEYAEAMESGQKFPPLLVFQDENDVDAEDEYILADGFHRLAAHLNVSPDEPIEVIVRQGTLDDARWESIGANKSHGLRRTNEDKRNATKLALVHPNGVDISDRKIAAHVGVSHTTVQNVRSELEATGKICHSTSRIGQDGRVINTENIGMKKTPPDGACCNDCHYFKDATCQRSGETPFPWNDACDDFEQKPLPEATEVDSDETPEKQARKTRGTSAHQYRRLKDCMTVYLPDDNPQLFAVELRNSFKEPYLRTCMQALEHILSDTE